MALSGRLSPLAKSVLDRAEVPDGPLVVALSGGADSAVCAWVAVAKGRQVRVVHVDHGQPASGAMAEAARDVAESLGIARDEVTVDLGSGGFTEGRARDARYAALEEAAKPDEVLMSGHTADDQAETVLGHLLRGAGTSGLAGIPQRRGRWCRPLLSVTRAEARTLADELGLPYRDDPANLDRSHRRNRIRNDLLPRLEAEYNPALREGLRRTAQLLRDDDAELERRAADVPLRQEAGTILIPAPLLATLPRSVASRAARRGLRQARGPHAGLADEVDAVVALAATSSGSVSLGDGLQATREGPWVALHGPALPAPRPVVLSIPGSVEFGPWKVHGDLAEVKPVTMPRGRVALLDRDAVGTEFEIRSATPGERIEINTGTNTGTKKALTVLSEAGIAVRHRNSWPVALARGKMAWVGGIRTAAWAGARPSTVAYVTLLMEE